MLLSPRVGSGPGRATLLAEHSLKLFFRFGLGLDPKVSEKLRPQSDLSPSPIGPAQSDFQPPAAYGFSAPILPGPSTTSGSFASHY